MQWSAEIRAVTGAAEGRFARWHAGRRCTWSLCWSMAQPLSLGRPEGTKDLRWWQGWGIPNARQGGQGADLCFLRGHRYKSAAWPFSYSSPPWRVVWWGQFELCLPGTYVSRRENANYLYLKIDWENILFSLFFFFSLLIAWWYLWLREKSKHHHWLGIQGLFLFG